MRDLYYDGKRGADLTGSRRKRGRHVMYGIISGFLSDRKGGVIFTCFGIWHLLYILTVAGILLFLLLFLHKKTAHAQMNAVRLTIDLAFGLYVLDFFLMPFAYGGIDVEKLPFHICTAMCVLCFLSRHNRFFEKYKCAFAHLGLISNLVYFLYPAGVGWQQVHPLSYRVIQTLLFHALMMVHGFLVLCFEDRSIRVKDLKRDLLVLIAMALWALLGNHLYNGFAGDFNYHMNWFFVCKDPFNLIDPAISVFIMPFISVAAFFIADTLLVGTAVLLRRRAVLLRRRKQKE